MMRYWDRAVLFIRKTIVYMRQLMELWRRCFQPGMQLESGIRSQSGLQLLLHFGINTVQLNGLYMKTHVRKGDVITEGKLLAEMNIAGVIKAGYDPDVYVIILESEHKKVTVFEREVYHGETLMEVRDTTERMQIE